MLYLKHSARTFAQHASFVNWGHAEVDLKVFGDWNADAWSSQRPEGVARIVIVSAGAAGLMAAIWYELSARCA